MDNKKQSSSSLDAGAACAAEPSFRVLYYGATGATVPFKWESQPGTPKHPLSGGASLPPLSPPPSYYAAAGASPMKPKKKKRTTLPRLIRRNSVHVSPGGSYSSSPTSSSSYGESSLYYSPSPSMTESKKAGLRSVLMCFGLTALVNGECGGYPVSNVKNALFSVMACRRSSHGAVDYVV